MVERANNAGADLIVVTGDFIDGWVAMRRADVEPLRALDAADGIDAIPGNHECFFDCRDWMQHLGELDIRMLSNAHGVVSRGGASLVLAGVTGLSAPAAGQAGPDLELALAGVPHDVLVLLLDHQPKNAPPLRRGVSRSGCRVTPTAA